jgi:hypothetical protein
MSIQVPRTLRSLACICGKVCGEGGVRRSSVLSVLYVLFLFLLYRRSEQGLLFQVMSSYRQRRPWVGSLYDRSRFVLIFEVGLAGPGRVELSAAAFPGVWSL